MFSCAAPTEPVRTTRPDTPEPQNNTTLDLLSPCGTASLAWWGRVHVPDPSAGLGSVQYAADVLLELTHLICEQFSRTQLRPGSCSSVDVSREWTQNQNQNSFFNSS